MRLMPRATIARICNVSVWEVLRRSFFTSVITLLPICALYIFGGATLQDFAFAIMVGIAIGAVGTIFIATPLLASLFEREPEYARRKALAEQETDAEACANPKRRSPPTRRPTRRSTRSSTAIEALTHVDVAGNGETDENGETNGDDEPDEADDSQAAQDAKRERRRQRRKTRPHGRAR